MALVHAYMRWWQRHVWTSRVAIVVALVLAKALVVVLGVVPDAAANPAYALERAHIVWDEFVR